MPRRPRLSAPFLLPVLVALVHTAAAQVQPDATPMDARREHWAWQPLADAAPPPDARHPVDAFVLARLRAEGLDAQPPAPPHQQLRRLWFDLVGLPPPPDVVARWLADPSERAWREQVDALLASPQFAERWARHWLDLVRYAETLGHEFDYEVPNAWRYRDYVIRALRDDVPYDQFVREHIAGDLLPAPRRAPNGDDESVQATASWWFCEQTHSPVDVMQHQADRIDNQIDVLGKAFLGMTVACARCHDHKFDAITARDYYGLFGFVQSSRYVQAPLQQVAADDERYRAALDAQRALARAWAAAQPLRRDPGCGPPAPAPAPTPGVERAGDLVLADAADPRSAWFFTNDGFGAAPWTGPFCPDPEAERPRRLALPGPFWLSCAAGPGREATLATRTFRIERPYVHVLVAGRESRVKLILDGFHVVRKPLYGGLHKHVDHEDARWRTFDVRAWRGHEAFVTAIDQRAPDLGDPHRDRGSYDDRGWIALQSVVASDHREPPPATAAALPQLDQGGAAPTVRLALAQLAAAQHALPVSPTVPAMADGTGRDSDVYLRGDHRRRGELAPRAFLSALASPGAAAFAASDGDGDGDGHAGSGRLRLADAVLAADNPLPARVLVNRVWHHLFGRGIVSSVDNLGALGDAPTHPELLDWLARDVAAHGWSLKHAIRRVVTSRTYRRSSRRPDDHDPDNLLLRRQNVRPLQAEAVRDALLAISGRLDLRMFGPPVELPEEAIQHARGRPRRYGPRDGDGRRSIYLAVRRNFLPPLLLAFDLPTPFAPVGRRNTSNVPAQALALANDAFVHDQCARWTDRVLAHSESPAQRVRFAYLLAFGREPLVAELERCLRFVAAAGDDARACWQDLLHALLLTTEFRFLR